LLFLHLSLLQNISQ